MHQVSIYHPLLCPSPSDLGEGVLYEVVEGLIVGAQVPDPYFQVDHELVHMLGEGGEA